MLLHNPYFHEQLGKQENDIQHLTRAALLYHVSKNVPDQLLNWGIENFWKFCMCFQTKVFLSIDTSSFDEIFFWQIFWRFFIFSEDFFPIYNLLTIVSFRIGVPSILLLDILWNLKIFTISLSSKSQKFP